MTADPITRAARRQTLLDRLGEHLTEWGCPPDLVPPRALALLHEVEQQGWSLPVVDVPPLSGRGSTPEGRARARRMLINRMRGCTCPTVDGMSLPTEQHPDDCPARGAGGTATPDSTANPASSPVDKIDSRSAPPVPAEPFRHSDGIPS